MEFGSIKHFAPGIRSILFTSIRTHLVLFYYTPQRSTVSTNSQSLSGGDQTIAFGTRLWRSPPTGSLAQIYYFGWNTVKSNFALPQTPASHNFRALTAKSLPTGPMLFQQIQ